MTLRSEESSASGALTSRITIATVNMNVVHDKSVNLRKIDAFIEDAAARGARLIVFPEQVLQGCIWSLSHEMTPEEWLCHRQAAEPIPGPSVDWLAERAARYNAVIVIGMTERQMVRGRETLYNACAVVGPQHSIGTYRKVHLVGDEVHLFQSGSSWPVFDTPVGSLGIFICYDCEFPEAARSLVLGGAQILVMPTAWAMTGDGGPDDRGAELYDLLTRVRAQENQTWLVAADQVGPGDVGDMRFYGHSRIVAPTGRIVAEIALEEGLAVASIDVVEGQRDGMLGTLPPGLDYLKDRRPDTYGRLCAVGTGSWLPATELRTH